MQTDEMVKYAQIFGYSVAGVSFMLSAFAYYKNNRVKRGEWLKALHEKFFESDNYKETRKAIEYEELDSFLNINDKGEVQNRSNEEKLVDYLNFFEFISVLQKRKHINQDEVKDLFGYFFKSIQSSAFLNRYAENYGFENLSKALNDYQ